MECLSYTTWYSWYTAKFGGVEEPENYESLAKGLEEMVNFGS